MHIRKEPWRAAGLFHLVGTLRRRCFIFSLTRHLVPWSWTWCLLVPQGKSVIYKTPTVWCFVIATWVCWYGMWANKATGSRIRMVCYYLEWKKKGTLFCLPHMPITSMIKKFWWQSWGDGSVGQWAHHASMRAWWGFEFEPLTPVTVYACNVSICGQGREDSDVYLASLTSWKGNFQFRDLVWKHHLTLARRRTRHGYMYSHTHTGVPLRHVYSHTHSFLLVSFCVER